MNERHVAYCKSGWPNKILSNVEPQHSVVDKSCLFYEKIGDFWQKMLTSAIFSIFFSFW